MYIKIMKLVLYTKLQNIICNSVDLIAVLISYRMLDICGGGLGLDQYDHLRT